MRLPPGKRIAAVAFAHKLLSGALLAIQAKQRERDERALEHRKLSFREEDLFRKSLGKTGLEHRRAPKPEKAESPHPLLGRALAWAEDFAAADVASQRRKVGAGHSSKRTRKAGPGDVASLVE